jgi:DNA-binding transcriptional LysR family regulator
MELRQLAYFVAVAEEASFTRAAARVHVAQPGVSAQVRQLERELGEPLLDRSGRTVRLTEIGAVALPFARAALEAVDSLRLAVDEFAGLVRGHVAVGMINGCGSLDLADLLAEFHQEHPGVEITLSEDNSDCLIDGLQAGHLDLAFVGLASAPPDDVETQVVVDEALMAAVRSDHPLAGTDAIALHDLREQPLISLPRGTGLRAALDDACALAGFQARIAFEASDLRMVAQLAARGLGVALLPESVAAAMAAELHPIAILQPKMRSRLELAWRAAGPVSPAARELIARARAKLGSG